MMSKTIENMVDKRLLDIADEYREQGYRVVLKPNVAEVPDFLARFQPDMVAYSERENAVVEVKSSRELAKSDYLTTLAIAVESVPGWRFDLIVINPDMEPIVAVDAEELSQDELQARAVAARQLVSIAQSDAATLLAWSGLEAAMRLLAEQKGIELEDKQPAYIIKALYVYGVISREDYDLLQRGMYYRNLIAHGYKAPIVDSNLLRNLISKLDEFLKLGVGSPAA